MLKSILPEKIKSLARSHLPKKFNTVNSLHISVEHYKELFLGLKQAHIYTDDAEIISNTKKFQIEDLVIHPLKSLRTSLSQESDKTRAEQCFVIPNANDIIEYYRTLRDFIGSGQQDNKAIHWCPIGEFSYIGGSIAATKNATAVSYSLFNHLSLYFGINEPVWTILVRSKFNQELVSTSFLMPHEEINEVVHGEDASGFSCTVVGLIPKLNKQYHHRWRFQFSVEQNKSWSTNHGVHHEAWGKTTATDWDFYPSNDGQNSSLEVVSSEASQLPCPIQDVKFPSKFTSEILMRSNSESYQVNNASIFGFGLCDSVFYGNHLISRHKNVALPSDRVDYVAELRDRHIIYNKYILPISNSRLRHGIRWPFEGAEGITLKYFDHRGYPVGECTVNQDRSPIWIDDYLSCTCHDSKTVWIYPETDLKISFIQPDLVVGLTEESSDSIIDFDITEFQSSWRNQRSHDPKLPHWLGKKKGILPSTKQIIGISSATVTEAYLLLSSGTPADIDKQGQIQSSKHVVTVTAYRNSKPVWIENLMLDLNDLKTVRIPNELNCLGVWFGIRAYDVDLVTWIVLIHNNNSVSCQHAWGY
ncbi:MAG: hypothetical protein F6J87_01380 [Spirulina sp. SIO3F2]|nr:hypothetical protein [Spirulina sp. SIO3F2]